jgi:DNA polymerase-1
MPPTATHPDTSPALGLLAGLTGAGVSARRRGGALQLVPKDRLTPEMLAEVKEHKAELLKVLRYTDTRYVYITCTDGLPSVIEAVQTAVAAAVDTETTGLSPRQDRVRLLSIYPFSGDGPAYLIDLFRIGAEALASLFGALARVPTVYHHAAFDLSFLWQLGFRPGPYPRAGVRDTLLMSHLLTAGTDLGNGLAEAAARHLAAYLPKQEQASDWSASTLSEAQLAYAAADPRATADLYLALKAEIQGAGLAKVAEIEHRAAPAFAWMGVHGVGFDARRWARLADEAAAQVEGAEAGLDALAGERPTDAPGEPRPGTADRWNWGSGTQVARALGPLGVTLPRTGKGKPSTAREKLALIDNPHPAVALLLRRAEAAALKNGKGRTWLEHVEQGARIYAGWQQLGGGPRANGRASCTGPNLHGVPRDSRYRRCFRAPPGRVLVKADYSQLQLRIAAKMTDDPAMRAAYREDGGDLHAATARLLAGKAEVTKGERQLAKAINFGLLFGMMPQTLRAYAREGYGVRMTPEEAAGHRERFFATYRGLAGWHRQVRDRRESAGCSRSLGGRRRLFGPDVSLPHRLAAPVQGSEADGAKLALALLWERRDECPGAFPVLFVHDELVVECDEAQADAAAAWLKRAMDDAMAPLLDPVPVGEIEAQVGATWGGDLPQPEDEEDEGDHAQRYDGGGGPPERPGQLQPCGPALAGAPAGGVRPDQPVAGAPGDRPPAGGPGTQGTATAAGADERRGRTRPVQARPEAAAAAARARTGAGGADLPRGEGAGRRAVPGGEVGGGAGPLTTPLLAPGQLWRVDQADCLGWLAGLPDGYADLTLGSPPYMDARTYGVGAQRGCAEWVEWMLEVTTAAVRVTRGLVLWVCAGVAHGGNYWPGCEGLAWEWWRRGNRLWRPCIWFKNEGEFDDPAGVGGCGQPGSGGKQWYRNDWEFVLAFVPKGGPVWSDPLANGYAPRWQGPPGGACTNRRQDGRRAHTKRRANGELERQAYAAPKIANPGNVVKVRVGGGQIGDRAAHAGEAPYPERLAEHFVRGHCPPGGIVVDPFMGTGTTAKAALVLGRRALGCDLRESQCALTRKRLAELPEPTADTTLSPTAKEFPQ